MAESDGVAFARKIGGESPVSSKRKSAAIYPQRIRPLAIARLGLAPAIVQQGDYVRGRRAYEDVFEQWKNADPESSNFDRITVPEFIGTRLGTS
jgi:hypothetical protein